MTAIIANVVKFHSTFSGTLLRLEIYCLVFIAFRTFSFRTRKGWIIGDVGRHTGCLGSGLVDLHPVGTSHIVFLDSFAVIALEEELIRRSIFDRIEKVSTILAEPILNIAVLIAISS